MMKYKRQSNSNRGPSNSWLPYVIGDCKAVTDFLESKTGFFWAIVKFLNALFRGVGQVVFANNPWSGLIILLCLYWADPVVGFATTLTTTTAIFTAFLFKQDEKKISSGQTYNAVLVGSVTASLWTPSYGVPITPIIWGFIILAAALSVLVNAALVNILGSFKPTLPSFTFAFNIVTILLFTTLQPRPSATSTSGRKLTGRSFEVGSAGQEYNSILQTLLKPKTFLENDAPEGRLDLVYAVANGSIDIGGIVQGVMLSMGQVYAVDCLGGSILMYLATLLYSPIVCIMSFVGATTGSLFGLVFAGPTYSSVYSGIWGFNAILAAIAVGGFFFVPTPLSFLLALADVAFVVFIQQALTLAFTPLNLPFLTFPFVISTILFLEVTATGDKLTRVTEFSFPEMHLHEFLQKKEKEENMNNTTMKDTRIGIYEPNEEEIPFLYPTAPPPPNEENETSHFIKRLPQSLYPSHQIRQAHQDYTNLDMHPLTLKEPSYSSYTPTQSTSNPSHIYPAFNPFYPNVESQSQRQQQLQHVSDDRRHHLKRR